MAYEYYQDPSQAWYGDPYGDAGWVFEDEPEEDTESQKLRKEQEMIEEIESNRLYLKKVRRRCVQEDFAHLEKAQMFLFEFLVETLQVNTKSELGLVPESEDPFEIVARVQFLNTPYLEIREKGEKIEGSDSVIGQTEYFEAVGNAGLRDAVDPERTVVARGGSRGSEEAEVTSGETPEEDPYDTKWENSSGKSLLFSKSALEIIQGLDKSPVKVQISMCVESTEEEGGGSCEPLGYALIRLPDHFSLSVLQSCKSGVILPVSCVHREACEVKNVFGVKKGELQVFVRLSCFGPVITTSFQSVGPERRYVFKPSPLPDQGRPDEESDAARNTVLKPIVADEEVAVGITVSKDEDVFQKTVLWKNNPQNCGCLDPSQDFGELKTSSLRMPRPSDVSLCRDPIGCKQAGKPFCKWHDLVSKEIKNNPGGNCGCIDNTDNTELLKNMFKDPVRSKENLADSSLSVVKPSRVEKMHLKIPNNDNGETIKKIPEKVMEPIKGLGIQPGPTDCNCDCPQIRNSIDTKPMMKYTWQVK